ncbi:MAG TPA: nucleotide exchange factor GrpE [Thermoanaerobaculia bacterium]|nr:nucleotide exchange factor GrpE [Thermoanaerobaculia bacterium]
MNDDTPKGEETHDDAYVLEDSGSIEEIEREMRAAAEEAAAASEIREDDAPAVAHASGSADEELIAENQQLRDRVLRTLADFENFRKRAEREKTDFMRFATAALMKDILPVLDNFDRALDHAEEGDDFHKGVLLIYKQLFDVLQRAGLRPIDENRVPFDPNLHEAVIREEDDSLPSHTVSAVLQKGYFLHDRLLRPALVKVAVGGPERTVAS